MRRNPKLLASTFIPMSLCSIEDEGSEAGGASSGGDQPASEANPEPKLTSEQELENEFSDPNTDDEDDSEDSDGNASDGEDSDDTEEDTGDDVEEAVEEEAGPKKNRAQERIDELTAQSRLHEREAEKWRQIAVENGAVPNAEATTLPEEPDPEKYPYGEHDAEYIRDRARYDTKIEVLEEQAAATLKAETEALDAKWLKNQAAAVERYPDFEEKVVKTTDKWPCSLVMSFGIKDSEVGPDVAYELASNVEEAQRIFKLSPLEQAREFGRMEQRHLDKATRRARKAEQANDDAPKPNIVSKAPTPPRRRVGGGGGTVEAAADTDDFAAFERMADAKLRKRA